MKKLFYILCLISSMLYGQQVVELCEGNQTTFTYSSNAGISGSYVWTVDGVDFIVNPLIYNWDTPGEYEIKLVFTSLAGCQDSVFYNVTVNDCQETTMWAPNCFTPNGDNKNEFWVPSGFNYQEEYFFIMNRWGELLFESYSLDNGWDGKVNGRDCPEGVYVYVLKWRDYKRKPYTLYGHITLLR